ncbi:glycosyl transferase family protein [Qipengyuania sediminis]|uniref:glycosyl transferase family protein n=1 Tax=Qipengyuania sediminis TaxID=1532023 RepID=UPI0010597BCE|nr:glycosyl transferase family protein [Qipengyuania sediminis]
MAVGDLAASQWFVLVRHELFLFAASFFLLGALDEMAVDIAYLWLRLTGRAATPRIAEASYTGRALRGRCAVFIPAWQESAVIAATIAHARAAWPQTELLIYIGCYPNDDATCAAAREGAAGDPRIKIVRHDNAGPTCKADCLNRLYRALCEDEARDGITARMIVLHDAEDMVDPAALALLDEAMDEAEFVQLPVMALPAPGSPWVSGHYTDEFAESHGKAMVVRSALGQGIPGAGVGCAVAREALGRLDARRRHAGPFAAGALTEDYELGLEIARLGGRTRFLRVRSEEGRLVATRAYFPTRVASAIRQKARWIHGIALQSWDRRGWHGSAAALWMQLRDRRGPLAALLLAVAYVLLIAGGVELLLAQAGLVDLPSLSPAMQVLLGCNLAALVWRLAARALFTWRDFGLWQAVLAIPRVIVSNTVAIVAARRAFAAYLGALRGGRVAWDKTEHTHHPADKPALRRAGLAA